MTKLAIKLFGYAHAQTILTRTIDGKHWYMARDICRLLGIKGCSGAVHRQSKKGSYNLNANEWQLKTEYTGTSNRHLLLVSESGMLKLIMKSSASINAEIQRVAAPLLASIK